MLSTCCPSMPIRLRPRSCFNRSPCCFDTCMSSFRCCYEYLVNALRSLSALRLFGRCQATYDIFLDHLHVAICIFGPALTNDMLHWYVFGGRHLVQLQPDHAFDTWGSVTRHGIIHVMLPCKNAECKTSEVEYLGLHT